MPQTPAQAPQQPPAAAKAAQARATAFRGKRVLPEQPTREGQAFPVPPQVQQKVDQARQLAKDPQFPRRSHLKMLLIDYDAYQGIPAPTPQQQAEFGAIVKQIMELIG
jgi:hypothetical protein